MQTHKHTVIRIPCNKDCRVREVNARSCITHTWLCLTGICMRYTVLLVDTTVQQSVIFSKLNNPKTFQCFVKEKTLEIIDTIERLLDRLPTPSKNVRKVSVLLCRHSYADLSSRIRTKSKFSRKNLFLKVKSLKQNTTQRCFVINITHCFC